MPADHTYDAAVVGGGPAGLAAALALDRCGIAAALVASPPQTGAPPDTRTAALFGGSVQLLRSLGVWDRLAPLSAPITAIRIVDDTGGLLYAPETSFKAADAARETFGYNVPNQGLVEALWDAVGRAPFLTATANGARLARLDTGDGCSHLTLTDGSTIATRLVVAADGRQSICRAAAGIATKSWHYDQSAVACTFTHSRPHRNISTELHRPAGPLTTVPMPGLASSLVWVERPAEAERLTGQTDAQFRLELETRLQGLLGSIGEIGPRRAFPLAGLTAETFGRRRVALVGETGHVIPPIGAQGLNLGLRDAATIADAAADAIAHGRDPGGDAVLAAYAEARMTDVTSRVWTVDVLNRSLITDLVPVHLLRGAGIAALKLVGPLRRLLVREGLQPTGAVPRLMQEPQAHARQA
jgi:2-octaprenyl-6-methoxyphenol hydroxylase